MTKWTWPAHANVGESKSTRDRKGFSYASELKQISSNINHHARWLDTSCGALRACSPELLPEQFQGKI
eukprot:1998524-Pleurochrysis_carterae.AAC.4